MSHKGEWTVHAWTVRENSDLKPNEAIIIHGDVFADDCPLLDKLVADAAELYSAAAEASFYSLTNGVPTMTTDRSQRMFFSSAELRELDRNRLDRGREYERRYRGTYSPIDEDVLTRNDRERHRAQDRITELEIALRNTNADRDRFAIQLVGEQAQVALMKAAIARLKRTVDWPAVRDSLEELVRSELGPTVSLSVERDEARNVVYCSGRCHRCKTSFCRAWYTISETEASELGRRVRGDTALADTAEDARQQAAHRFVAGAIAHNIRTIACSCVRDFLAEQDRSKPR